MESKVKAEETLKATGSVTIKLIGPDGQVKQEHTNHNLVVTVGKTYLTTFLTPGNLTNVLRQITYNAILAIGQTFVILCGSIVLT